MARFVRAAALLGALALCAGFKTPKSKKAAFPALETPKSKKAAFPALARRLKGHEGHNETHNATAPIEWYPLDEHGHDFMSPSVGTPRDCAQWSGSTYAPDGHIEYISFASEYWKPGTQHEHPLCDGCLPGDHHLRRFAIGYTGGAEISVQAPDIHVDSPNYIKVVNITNPIASMEAKARHEGILMGLIVTEEDGTEHHFGNTSHVLMSFGVVPIPHRIGSIVANHDPWTIFGFFFGTGDLMKNGPAFPSPDHCGRGEGKCTTIPNHVADEMRMMGWNPVRCPRAGREEEHSDDHQDDHGDHTTPSNHTDYGSDTVNFDDYGK